MWMGDRLLVPLDGSARSEAVLFALDLWAAAVDEVFLLQVRARPRWPRYARGHIESAAFQERAAEWHALNYLTIVSVPLQRRGWQVRPLLRFGEPAEQIVAVAEAEHVRAIVLAGTIPLGVRAVWRGRVLQRLIERASMPVVVFHPGQDVARAATAADG
jgi:nucleotide-binding universal stress UspA family protein